MPLGWPPSSNDSGLGMAGKDFESLYSGLATSGANEDLLREIEETVFDYFRGLRLPDHPTLYDHLVLSLRRKDGIAAFNWDPLLWQALVRIAAIWDEGIAECDLPPRQRCDWLLRLLQTRHPDGSANSLSQMSSVGAAVGFYPVTQRAAPATRTIAYPVIGPVSSVASKTLTSSPSLDTELRLQMWRRSDS